jgi:hypothetical protein
MQGFSVELHPARGGGGLAGPRADRTVRQDDQEEPERAGAHPDRDRLPAPPRPRGHRRRGGAGAHGRAVLHRRGRDGSQRPDPRHPLCDGPQAGRAERGGTGRHPGRAGRPPVEIVHPRAGRRAAAGLGRHQDARLHRAVHRHRHPHRGSQGTAVGRGRPRRRRAPRSGLAVRARSRRHQDTEIPAHPGAAAACRWAR